MSETRVLLDPIHVLGTYVFCSLPFDSDLQGAAPVVTVRETEGLSVVVTDEEARARGWTILYRAAWIRFGLVSALDAVGLTAGVSQALAAAGISCNMVAGAYHDHVFVPVERASEALRLLQQFKVPVANNA